MEKEREYKNIKEIPKTDVPRSNLTKQSGWTKQEDQASRLYNVDSFPQKAGWQ